MSQSLDVSWTFYKACAGAFTGHQHATQCRNIQSVHFSEIESVKWLHSSSAVTAVLKTDFILTPLIH